MVKAFAFSGIRNIYFKKGKLNDLPSFIEKFGNNIALVTGQYSFDHSPYSTRLFTDLDTNKIKYQRILISGEPSPQIIDNAVKELAGKKIDAVVAIGGGSVIDAGKAVSAMMNKTESVKVFLEGVGLKKHPGTKLPFIAIPTTSGTGSEATNNAVISETGKNGFKKSLRHANFIPDIALVDPELTLTCPPDITAASGMDSFTQLTEAYLSDKSGPYTDALALEGLKAIKSSLEKAFKEPECIKARTGMSFAALTSGICLANAGLGALHGFASSIGGKFNIPHGLLCGTLMAPANEINVRELRKLSENSIPLYKYVTLAKIFITVANKSDDYYIDSFINYLYKLSELFKFPTLNNYDIHKSDIEQICDITEIKNNPVKLSKAELMEILNRRIS